MGVIYFRLDSKLLFKEEGKNMNDKYGFPVVTAANAVVVARELGICDGKKQEKPCCLTTIWG